MRHIIFCVLLFAITAHAEESQSRRHPQFHILPDAPSSAYQGKYKLNTLTFQAGNKVKAAIQLGERNLSWLQYMNSFRPEGQKLQLTKPGDLKGIPIEKPNFYNALIITKEFETVQAEMPEAMRTVLYTNENFPKDLPLSEKDYVLWAKKVDKNYQTAVRWTMMAPYLPMLELERKQDLRGFYFLSKKVENVESFLRSIDTLSEEKRNQVRTWLVQMCQNKNGLTANCKGQVEKSVQQKQAYEFYLKFLPNSQNIWNSFFKLFNPRPEIQWTLGNPLEMLVPFMDPSDNTVLDFLKFNIEDEWKWDQWQLKLDFQKTANIHVEFQSGVVPHVNGLGGDTIVMDKNTPLTEWDVQWTIRHEFGHVLGFTDCYLEFYDPDVKAIINYQLDIENMMCARSGRMQETHFTTLKSSYQK